MADELGLIDDSFRVPSLRHWQLAGHRPQALLQCLKLHLDRMLGFLDGSLDPFLPIRAFRLYHVAKSAGAYGTLLDVLNNALIGVLNDALL
jgi:hypothetical protein